MIKAAFSIFVFSKCIAQCLALLMPSALPSLRGVIIEPGDSSCIVVMPGRSGIVKSPGSLSMKQTCPT